MLPTPSAPAPGPTPLSPRKKGIRFGAKFLFASIVTFPLIVGMCVAADSPGPLVISFLLFLIGVSRMVYARIFEDDYPHISAALPQPLVAAPSMQGALPSYQAPVWTPRIGATTGELQQPPSVTEHTTNLLEHPSPGRATE